MKVLFTYRYSDEDFQKVKALGYGVDYCKESDIGHYDQKDDVDILVCYNPFKSIDLKEFSNLKYIFLSSIGFDQLPLETVQAMKITVCNNRGGYSIPMGEWIVMRILESFKHTKLMYKRQEQKVWHTDTSVEEAYRKRVLFFGTGTIASEAAKRLQGFDMTLVGLNTRGQIKPYFNECYPLTQSRVEVSKADVVVIALPLTEKTSGYFDKDHIDAMQEHAYLINIARGEIIDENALIQALENYRIKGAALDVFNEEPLKDNHPLWSIGSVTISCHNSWVSEQRNQRRFEKIYENLKRKANQEPLINVLDLKRGY